MTLGAPLLMRRLPTLLPLVLWLGTVSGAPAGPKGRRIVGSVPAEAREAVRLGPADPDLPLERIVFILSPRDPSGLEKHLAAQNDPASPGFRRWLTPEEFGRRFGAREEDVGLLAAWLEEQGLRIDEVTRGRTALLASGRVADVERALGTPISEYVVSGEPRFSNDAPPSLPSRVAGPVAGILSLDGFQRRRPVSRPEPAYTSGGSYLLGPADFSAIYGLDPLWAAGLDGAGRKIAVVASSNVNPENARTFRSFFGLPANDPVVVLNGPDPGILTGNQEGFAQEATLDLQWAGAVAPRATVLLIVTKSTAASDGIDLSSLYAVDQNAADVISVSYGACEIQQMTAADMAFYGNLWAQAAAQGITVAVASGDGGAAGCDDFNSVTIGTVAAVNGLSSSPYDVCVGGTQFDDGGSPSTYWNASNDPITKRSVKGYIPETTWNQSGLAPGGRGILGTGGGVSAVFAKPAWQAAPGVPADGKRDVPDVALAASGKNRYLFYYGRTGSSLFGVSGTSVAAPDFAGLAAILAQKAGGRLGNLNPVLYALGRSQYGAGGPAVFHDVTTGSNSVPGVMGYDAGPGYDMASGLGSVDAQALAAAWPAAGPSPDFQLAAAPAWVFLPGDGVGGATVRLSIETQAGADVTASLALEALPAGVTASFSPARNAASGTGYASTGTPCLLTLAASPGAVTGVYTVGVSASAGGIARRVTIQVAVRQGLGPVAGIELQVPVILDVFGAAGSHYTSDLTAVNRSPDDTTLLVRYAAAPGTPGGGGPLLSRSLPSGRHLYVPDVIAYLRGSGYDLPADASAKIGTLYVTFAGLADTQYVWAGSRTTTPNRNAAVGGAFGTFMAAVPVGSAAASPSWVYGLRENASFRSNLALVHSPGGASSLAPAGPITLDVQSYSSEEGGPFGTPVTLTLQPGEFRQINSVLAGFRGTEDGYVQIQKVSGTDRFLVYGVVNDGGAQGGNGTSDGSLIVSGGSGGLVPIVLDLPGGTHYQTELSLTNATAAAAPVTLTYTPSAALPGSSGGGIVPVTLSRYEQRIVPNAIDFLRSLGLPIPNDGSKQGGTLLVTGVVALARTYSPNPDPVLGGTYGVAYPALDGPARATEQAFVYGLRQDSAVRSNLAIADARVGDPAAVEYVIDVFDSDGGAPSPALSVRRTLTGGQWIQLDGILASAGIRHGYARVRPSGRSSDFVTYGIVNDGPDAGSRTSDGSYLPMVVVPVAPL